MTVNFSTEQFAGPFFDFFRSAFMQMRGSDDSGLIKIETLKNCSMVCKLWYDFAMQTSLKVRVEGSRLISNTDYTPYLYALDYGRKDLTPFIAQREGGFTKRFIAMKCDALVRYEIKGSYAVDGVSFDSGVDHEMGHNYFSPRLCRSWERFFKEFVGEPFWDAACTEEFLNLINTAHCTSCSTDFKKLTLEEIRQKWGERMFLVSDSASAVCKNAHWIDFVIGEDQIAIGNRGSGCGEYSGVRIYPISAEMRACPVEEWIDLFQKKTHTYYLPLPDQWSGSCFRMSFEAAALGALFFILQKQHPLLTSFDLKAKAGKIMGAWLHFDRTLGLKKIMKSDAKMHYDPHLLIRILAVFQDCPKTAEAFHRFLRKEKRVDWSVLNATEDTKGCLPLTYLVQRKNTHAGTYFRDEAKKMIERRAWHTMWKSVYSSFLAKRCSHLPLPDAPVEQMKAFIFSAEAESLLGNFGRDMPYAIHRAVMMKLNGESVDCNPDGRGLMHPLMHFRGNCGSIQEEHGVFYFVGNETVAISHLGHDQRVIRFQNPTSAPIESVHFSAPFMIIHTQDDLLRCVNVENGVIFEISDSCIGVRVREKELFVFSSSSKIEIWDLKEEAMRKIRDLHLYYDCLTGAFDIYKDEIYYVVGCNEIAHQSLYPTQSQTEPKGEIFELDAGAFNEAWEHVWIEALKIERDQLVVFMSGQYPIEEQYFSEYGCCIFDLTGKLETRYGKCCAWIDGQK